MMGSTALSYLTLCSYLSYSKIYTITQYSMNLLCVLTNLVLNVSVEVIVPEQSLVTITPEAFVGSDVLVVVLHWPLFIREVLGVLSVLSVLQFNFDNWDSSEKNGWEGNKVGDLLPQVGNTFRMVNLFFSLFDELFTGCLVHNRESGFVYVLGSTEAMAVRVETGEAALNCSSKHSWVVARME